MRQGGGATADRTRRASGLLRRYVRSRKALVIGIGRSNLPVVEYLLRAGAEVTAADRKTPEQLGPRYQRLADLPVKLALGPNYLDGLGGYDIAFLTPGMRRDLPEIAAAAARGTRLSSETELFFDACPAPIVGITGSAGKTTTTTMVGEMLRASRDGVWVGGNIGRPLLGEVERIRPTDLVVLELSSFQLQDLAVSPGIGAVLNISPNHLDIHPTMEHYVNAKRNIYRHQEPADFTVFNYDNPTTRQMAREYDRELRGRRGGHPPVVYSRRAGIADGAFVAGDTLFVKLSGYAPGLPDAAICRRSEVRLVGEHNLENVLAAAALAGLAGAAPGAIRGVATTFAGVEHRLERVREVGGVQYYNDSIATAPDRTVAALRSLPGPVVLILGGYDKKLGFEGLAEEILIGDKVRQVILMGQTAELIAEALSAARDGLTARGVPHAVPGVERATGGLAEVVAAASRLARPGDVVIMSPACASFDEFTDFEERGHAFKRLVAGLPEQAGP